MQAVRQAKAVYRLETPAEPVFVQWVVDPEKAMCRALGLKPLL